MARIGLTPENERKRENGAMEKTPFEPVVPTTTEDIKFLDAGTQNCPYHAYKLLRDELKKRRTVRRLDDEDLRAIWLAAGRHLLKKHLTIKNIRYMVRLFKTYYRERLRKWLFLFPIK